jgi:hypothetical protein
MSVLSVRFLAGRRERYLHWITNFGHRLCDAKCLRRFSHLVELRLKSRHYITHPCLKTEHLAEENPVLHYLQRSFH